MARAQALSSAALGEIAFARLQAAGADLADAEIEELVFGQLDAR